MSTFKKPSMLGYCLIQEIVRRPTTSKTNKLIKQFRAGYIPPATEAFYTYQGREITDIRK
jgi:hypothetical protein